jgi:hypothetical protein
MEEIQTFTVNPSFLQEYWPQNYDDFGFTFETDSDWAFKSCSFKWQVLDPNIWAWIFLMRWELIKAHRKERDQYKKKIQAVEQRELYKAEMKNLMKRNERQKKDNHYQERTCALYRKILERFVELPNEERYSEQ